MVTTTPEAPSVKKGVTKEDVLKLIVRREINNGCPLFYQPYLDREFVLGAIGDRGGGKSGSEAVISIVDFMIRGRPVWSNMKISCDIFVDDGKAIAAGLNSGGVVHYESLPLEKAELLKLDETYRNGCLVIEEINVQYSNVRRFMTNTNIESNEVWQQLRKFKTSLLYNVIDEMFIDPQLRALTDVYIRTYDTAFDVDSMLRKKKPGIDFCWLIHHMTGYLSGEQGRYAITHKAEKAYFHFAPWRGVYDDKRHQIKGVYSLNKRERQKLEAELSVESSEETKDAINEWQWLIDGIRKIKNAHIEYLEASQLWQVLEIMEHGKTPQQMGSVLPSFGINKHHQNNKGKWVFKIDSYTIESEAHSLTQPAARNTN